MSRFVHIGLDLGGAKRDQVVPFDTLVPREVVSCEVLLRRVGIFCLKQQT